MLINTLRITECSDWRWRPGHLLPGPTLDKLEQVLAPLGREPHSVIGSSCIGASVLGGICNNSGGSLVRRGPPIPSWRSTPRCGPMARWPGQPPGHCAGG
ncbi:hypothetical protein [Comamonas sp. JC664]|uniref:hypothetical protein n=1 Tax=Comamonas sp. JC664 TaxID=2801917 RepID=UPI0036118C3A